MELYGNVQLTQLSAGHIHRIDISVPGREAHGASDFRFQELGACRTFGDQVRKIGRTTQDFDDFDRPKCDYGLKESGEKLTA